MKKSNILIAALTVLAAVTSAKAEGPMINFDGNSVRTVNFMNAVEDNEAIGIQPTPVPPPTPSVDTLLSYNGISEMGKIAQSQQGIKAFVASYNQHVLHDIKVGTDLQLEGVAIALKLPSQVLVTKNGVVLDTIDNVIMVNTIRHNLGGSGVAITRGCAGWIVEVIAIWVIDHYIEKVVKRCETWIDEQGPKPGNTPTPTNTQDQHPEQPTHWQHQY